MTCTGARLAAVFAMDSQLSVPRDGRRSPTEIASRYRASHIAMNPYDPPNESNAIAGGRTRWVRRFLILNGILPALPVSIIAFIYASLWIETALQPDTINGDPVTYQHEFVGISGPVWPMVAFFVFQTLSFLPSTPCLYSDGDQLLTHRCDVASRFADDLILAIMDDGWLS